MASASGSGWRADRRKSTKEGHFTIQEDQATFFEAEPLDREDAWEKDVPSASHRAPKPSWLPKLRPLSVAGADQSMPRAGGKLCVWNHMLPIAAPTPLWHRAWNQEAEMNSSHRSPMSSSRARFTGRSTIGDEAWSRSSAGRNSARSFYTTSTSMWPSDSSEFSLTATASEGSLRGLRAGVSRSARLQNARAEKRLKALANSSIGEAVASSCFRKSFSKNLGAQSPTGKASTSNVDLKAFSFTSERITAKISELWSSHEAFDPRRHESNSPSPRNSPEPKSRGNTDPTSAEDEQRAERLEAYKMFRTYRGELPPIGPITDQAVEERKFSKPDKSIMLHNMNEEALAAFRPEARMERLQTAGKEHADRLRLAAQIRIQQSASETELITQDLARKRAQAEVASLKSKLPKVSQSRNRLLQQMLLKIAVSAYFMQTMVKKLKVRMAQKVTTKQQLHRLSFFSTESVGNLDAGTAVIPASIAEQEPDFSADAMWKWVARMHMLRIYWKAKKSIRAAEVHARTVFKTLKSWIFAGRCLFMMKRVAMKIRLIQRWWRDCARRLHHNVHFVFVRWDHFERQEILKVIQSINNSVNNSNNNAAAGGDRRTLQRQATKKAVACSQLHTQKLWEAQIEAQMSSEESRLVFIRHELRARRFFLLPQIAMWEKEAERWRNTVERYLETKMVYSALGISTDSIPTHHQFSWPPCRPSYMPSPHFNGEVPGHACHPGCFGKKGDEVILEMVRRMRNDLLHQGWREIPKSCISNQTDNRARMNQKLEQARAETPETRFGTKAKDEDLKQLGIEAGTFPGGEPPLELIGLAP